MSCPEIGEQSRGSEFIFEYQNLNLVWKNSKKTKTSLS
jgi:hypothetical protein